MATVKRLRWLLLLLIPAVAAGATYLAVRNDDAPQPAAGPTSPAAEPTPTQSPEAEPSPEADQAHPVSLPALMEMEFDGRGLTVGRVLLRTGAYTRHFITYQSGELTISGIMNVPTGDGPFPVVILNHGYIDPAVYTNGRGLRREQDYLARRGYVVIHPDYRNHAQSDPDPESDLKLRLGYTEDVVNAVLAVRRSSLDFIDGERVGMLGHSMGGGVALNVAVVAPDLVDAIVLFAPVSSNTVDNFNKWIRRTGDRRRLAERIVQVYGSPEQNPQFWRNVSPVTFFDRVEVPIAIHHGTVDASVPLAWSRSTFAALQEEDKEAILKVYRGEPHEFARAWPTVMARTALFFDTHVKG